MTRHSAESRKLLRALDDELAAASARLGENLVWTEQDKAILDLIAAQIDRKTDLSGRYDEAEDTKTRLKLSTELRLLETGLARLLKQVNVEPAVSSRRSQQSRRAARARWDRRGA